MPPRVSVSIKVIEEERAKDVAHIKITPIAGSGDADGYGDYKYMVQEPGGAILEGEINNFHEHRGVLTLIGLTISASGHYGQMVQVPASEIANMLGHEKMEEIAKKLKDQGD